MTLWFLALVISEEHCDQAVDLVRMASYDRRSFLFLSSAFHSLMDMFVIFDTQANEVGLSPRYLYSTKGEGGERKKKQSQAAGYL